MADVTVSELAKVVGVPVERLLSQVKEAGLPHTKADDPISNEDKNTLLLFLRRSHGDTEATDAAPKKITLKRKTVETLKSASSHGRGKTVAVEVRKKRTYVKRSELQTDSAGGADSAEQADELQVNEQEFTAQMEPAQTSNDQAAIAQETDAKDEIKAGATEKSAPDAQPEKKAADATDTRNRTTVAPKSEPPKGARKDGDDKDDDKNAFRKKDKAPARKQGAKGRVATDDFVLEDSEYGDGPRGRRGGRKKARGTKQHGFEKPTEFISREITIGEANSVTDLAQKMSVKSAEVVKMLFKMGVMATINQVLDQDTTTLLIEEMGHTARFVSEDALEESLYESISYDGGGISVARAPVVTVMGHVDHGKTSLLDYIRKATVVSHEAGGITQHIGAYHVETPGGMICFLDTPGHAAFSAMRSRGAKATDVVVLVVAADDGVKPQTEEAIQHARSAGVPLVVAINKVDKPDIDLDRVRNELAQLNVISDAWGGDTQFVEVSAHTGQGIEQLLEAILLQAELLELKAFVDAPGKGVVIESRLDKGRGPVASVLVQNGTLKVGDMVLVGHEFGRVRALIDEMSQSVKSAGPSIPVEILGLNGVPEAGDEFVVVADEKKAREVAQLRRERHKDNKVAMQQTNKVESMFAGIGRADVGVMNIVLKTDVRGSLEAIVSSLHKLGTEEVQVNIVSAGVGGISETDAHLAATSKAMIVGFNVRADKSAREIIENEGLELRYYNIIYNVIDDAKAILGGMLSPELREEILGVAEVRDVFNSPKFGQIAGSMVVEGTVYRNKPIRVLRNNVVIYEGELESLRRFKDEASQVRMGMECGIGVKNYTDVQIGDKIEVYQTTEVARTLE
ncbi:MAG: translation initiation factor IF-2 [Gammaproteobacteria bacterium]|nr:translation initiation factor IF-2 [Gammaproteobacteria bacterium]